MDLHRRDQSYATNVFWWESCSQDKSYQFYFSVLFVIIFLRWHQSGLKPEMEAVGDSSPCKVELLLGADRSLLWCFVSETWERTLCWEKVATRIPVFPFANGRWLLQVAKRVDLMHWIAVFYKRTDSSVTFRSLCSLLSVPVEIQAGTSWRFCYFLWLLRLRNGHFPNSTQKYTSQLECSYVLPAVLQVWMNR